MKQIIFSIHDSKAEAYINPFFLPTEGLATRSFGDCVNDPNHQFYLNPADYTLFAIGEFDSDTGVIEYQEKRSLGNGVDFKRQEKIDAISNES